MNCSGYTYKNLPCKNKAQIGGRCWLHEGGVTLDTMDLERIEENRPFEMRQGDRTFYISINQSMGDLHSEVRRLKDRNEILYERLERLTEQRVKLLDYSGKLEAELLGYNQKIEIIKEKIKFSIPFSNILKIKPGACLNMHVSDDTSGENYIYNISRSSDIEALHNEIKRLKFENKKLNVKGKPNNNYKEIKKENDKLKEAVESLKERVAAHSAISKVCYTYEAFDKYINDTVERITGYTRDYPAGIYNKITDFMRIKNISRICYSDLGITASDFYKQFIDLRNDRNRTCHPQLKKRDKKRVADFIVDYLK